MKMTPLTCKRLTLFAAAAVFLQMIGLSLFVLGFFPVKPALSGISGPESFHPPDCSSVEYQNLTSMSPDQLKSLYRELSQIPPLFDRLIFMVIDGLPAEFVLGKGGEPPSRTLLDAMPYTQALLADGMAFGFHAKAAPPTVTMPRLKAMTSGSIGGFLDVAFNFNTQALLDDNLIGQFFRIGWKMVMLGDETWLKLFPGLFARHDGVGSFFVKDTVQVDHNVSRHLSDELYRTDWNLLILHYLGLDHVGHIGGRNSVLMGPKLNEMDEVIKKIHSSTLQIQESDQGRTLLVVVSDHGMAENGNHGGSSYEETDSLALFIGLNKGHTSAGQNTVNQVDIAPTLALLFGIPIPTNNGGNLIAELFHSLTEDQQLRVMELNAWQLLRLIRAQSQDSTCRSFSCHAIRNARGSGTNRYTGSVEDISSCLYLDAAALHKSWKSKKLSGSEGSEDYASTVLAYRDFLRTASEALSRRVTDKPFGLLATGVVMMLLSCFLFIGLLYLVSQEVSMKREPQPTNINIHKWYLAETFTPCVILVLVLSMGSSSMVEEEHYVWHFMTYTFYLLLLRRTLQSFKFGVAQTPLASNSYIQMCLIAVIVISGRVLRGWHQGGVNWTYLPDISKWLETAGSTYIKSIQLFSVLLVIGLCSYDLSSLWSKSYILMVLRFILVCAGLLVVQNIAKYQDKGSAVSDCSSTLVARAVYTILAISTVGTAVATPWLMPSQYLTISSRKSFTEFPKGLLVVIKDSIYITGSGYIFSWCLLQLLLQPHINSMPIVLLLVQILASVGYASDADPHVKEWVEIAALYFLGMSGHFSLGNTNTLATIDVAGAFIGVSSHSTLFSGVLMFAITYASPMLTPLGMVMYISVKHTSSLMEPQDLGIIQFLKMTLGYTCLVPLGINSVLLVAYTIVLLLMRNHLFVWSVFSPKYLYVCATTVCVWLGVFIVATTVTYTILSISLRRHLKA